tara:strand:- start:2482 stop:3129 length:648 start_codon:yes stop_codon:yes gene_type:complete
MGYLNNQVVTVDAILTKKGRELLAQGGNAFNITQFSLADDEVDYSLYNPSHPSGSAYYGEAIENMPLLEAFPNELQTMKYKLVTLPRSTAVMPTLTIGTSIIQIDTGEVFTIEPKTQTFEGIAGEQNGYTATMSNITYANITGGGAVANTTMNNQTTLGTNVSKTVVGNTITLEATSINIFGSSTVLYATLTLVGRGTGARLQVPVELRKSAGMQ